MLYRDVDQRLDMQMTISMELTHPLIPLIAKELQSITIDSIKTDSNGFLDLFICGEDKKKLSGFLAKYESREIGDCHVIRINFNEMLEAFKLADDIARIPSTIRGGFYLRGRRIFSEYRFHSSDLEAITELGREIMSSDSSVRLSDVGPSKGGISLLNSIDSRIHIGIVSFDCNILDEMKLSENVDYMLEVNNYTLSRDGAKVVTYYPSRTDSTDFGKSHVKDIEVNYMMHPFLLDIWDLSVRKRLPRAAILAKYVNGKHRSFVFLPASMIDEQISIIYQAAEKHPDVAMRLVAAREYSDGIWEWI